MKRLAFALAGLALVEAGVRAFVVKDGCIGWRPLPPFGATPHPRQRAWLAERLREIGAGAGDSIHFDAELGWTWTRPGAERTSAAPEKNPEAGSADLPRATLDRETRGPGHYAAEKAAGVLRVACFGDSFTFCSDVGDEEAWPRLVETSRPNLEVANFGVPAYGTDQALLRFRRFARDLSADVVLLGVMLENIGRNVNRYRPLWYPTDFGCLAKPRFVLEGGGLHLVLLPYATERELVEAIAAGRVLSDLAEHEHWRDVPALGPLRASMLARIAGGWLAYRDRDPQRLWRDPAGEGARVTIAIAEAFHREAIAAGARLAPVLILPGWPDVQELSAGRRFWKWAVDELEQDGVPVIEPSDALLASGIPLRSSDGKGTLYGGGGHLAVDGNRIVARIVGAWIEERTRGR